MSCVIVSVALCGLCSFYVVRAACRNTRWSLASVSELDWRRNDYCHPLVLQLITKLFSCTGLFGLSREGLTTDMCACVVALKRQGYDSSRIFCAILYLISPLIFSSVIFRFIFACCMLFLKEVRCCKTYVFHCFSIFIIIRLINIIRVYRLLFSSCSFTL